MAAPDGAPEHGTRVTLFDPTGLAPLDATWEPADALRTLEGCRIGLLFNTKPNADILLREVGDELARRYGAKVWDLRRKPEVAAAAPGELRLELHGSCDAVITASGD